MSDWFPAICTTSLLALVVYLFRKLIVTRLTNAVKHEYDEKLENLKADLKRKDLELDTLRDTALKGLSHRQKVLFEKQLEAAGLLWTATLQVSGGKVVSEMMFRVKTEVASGLVAKDEKTRLFFKLISGNANIEKMSEVNAWLIRPFVTDSAWNYFEAYQSIIWHFVLQAKLFENGCEDKFLKTKEMIELVKAVLPHYGDLIDTHGVSVLALLLDELQEKILAEIKAMLSGEKTDMDSLNKAAQIQTLAKNLKAQTNPGTLY